MTGDTNLEPGHVAYRINRLERSNADEHRDPLHL